MRFKITKHKSLLYYLAYNIIVLLFLGIDLLFLGIHLSGPTDPIEMAKLELWRPMILGFNANIMIIGFIIFLLKIRQLNYAKFYIIRIF